MLQEKWSQCVQARSHGVAWGGNVTPEQQDAIFLPPLRSFLQLFLVALSLQPRRHLLKFRLISTFVFVASESRNKSNIPPAVTSLLTTFLNIQPRCEVSRVAPPFSPWIRHLIYMHHNFPQVRFFIKLLAPSSKLA